jgi:filamentous hemagglutinin family protein
MARNILILTLVLLNFPLTALALPLGGKVAGGSATIKQPNAQTLNINQLTDKAIINWKGFNINVNELVKFSQPNSNAIILNRVTGVDPSSILGRLIANGRVFIINPNGILFGPSSVVDVAGLLATTLNIKDSDFMAGRFNFSQDPGNNPSYVVNQGQIKVSDNGFVFLVAPGVSNEGLVIANLGKVVMGSGEKLNVDFMGDGLITFAIDGRVSDQVRGADGTALTSAVSNAGTIKADGGQVILTARASSEIFSSVVNNSGVIEAKSLVNRGGVIRLEGSDPVANTGEIGWQANLGRVQNAEGAVINTGTLDVSAAEAGAAQGQVTLSGHLVGNSGSILARGADNAQGGNVLITSSEQTVLTSNSLVDASGGQNSSAGNVVVWSDKDTIFHGTILATGGELGGGGGNVEVSGYENLAFSGRVDASSPLGTAGTILLDPRNITIVDSAGGNNVEVTADNSVAFNDGGAASNFTIDDEALESLTGSIVLQARRDITINAGLSGGLNLSNQTGGERVTFQAGRHITVNSPVITNGAAITLEADSPHSTLGAADGSGNLTINAGVTSNGGAITFLANDFTISQTVNAGAGDISIARSQTNQSFNLGTGAGDRLSNAEIGQLLTTGALTIGQATTAGSDGLGTGALTRTADTITANQAITIGAAGGGSVQLVANDGVTLSQSLTTNQPTTINADADAGDNSGTFTVANTRTLSTSNNALTITANDLNLNASGAINSGTAAISIADSDGTGIGFGATAVASGLNISGGELQNITATGLTLQTPGNITVDNITAANSNNIAGTVTLNATGAASTVSFATNPSTFNTLAVNAGNNITIGVGVNTDSGDATLVGGTIASNATLSAPGNTVSMTATTGAITDGNGGAANVVASNLTASAVTGIDLDTTISTLTSANVTGAGNIDISNSGALAVTSATTTNGNIILNATGGNLTANTVSAGGAGADVTISTTTSGDIQLGTVTAPDTVTLTSAGAITDTNGAANNIAAASLAMTAVTGIGTSGDALETTVSNLEASGGIGGVFVTNTGALTLGGVSGALSGVSATGSDITITALSPLTVSEPISNTGGGNITLTAGAGGAADDLTVNAIIGASGGNGNITLTADDNLIQNADVTAAGAGTVTATAANGSITMAGGASTSSGTGDITYSAATNIAIASLSTAGNVDVTASGGAISDANGAANNITATTGNLSAGTNIGTAADPIETTVSTLTASAGSGGVFITESDGATVTASSTGAGPINLSSTTGDLTISTVSTPGGAVTLSIPAGAIQDSNGVANNVTADSLTVSAATGIDLDTTINTLASANVTGVGNIDISNTGALSVTSATTANGNITLNATGGNLSINAITAGGAGSDVMLSTTTSGNIQLGSVTTSDTVTLTSAGAITDTNGAANNISATTTNLTAVSNIGASGDPIETTVGTLTASAGAGGVFITESDGATVTASASGAGLINLASTTGDLTVNTISTPGGTVTLSTPAGAIQDGNGAANNVTADSLTASAATGIDLDTTVSTLSSANVTGAGSIDISNTGAMSVTSATTTNGNIELNATGGNLTIGTVSAGGAGSDVTLSTVTSGDIQLGTVTAPDTVKLTSAGAITDTNGAATNVTANSLTASAVSGIDLDTAITTLNSATLTGAGNIDISNTGALTVTGMSTPNGSIILNATGGSLTVDAITAGGAGSDVSLSTTTSGDVLLGSVTAPDMVTVTSAGAISDTNGAANNISATTTNLTAAANIGTAVDPIEMNVATLNATSTGGGVFIAEADGVTVNNVLAGGGNIVITNSTGDMTINALTATAGGIDLTANAGSILDGNGAANNISAVADSTLSALGGVIGLSADPIEVNINPGTLSVEATGQIGGVSVDINGTVLPADTLTLLSPAPGNVIFNGNVLNPSTAPVNNATNFTWVISNVDSQRVNENDSLTESLVENDGEAGFEAELEDCEIAEKTNGATCYAAGKTGNGDGESDREQRGTVHRYDPSQGKWTSKTPVSFKYFRDSSSVSKMEKMPGSQKELDNEQPID